MKKVLLVFTMLILSGFIQAALCTPTAPDPASVPRMTKERLKAQLGYSNFVIIDVRATHDWQDSAIKIKGAIREDPSKLDSWIKKYTQNKTIVLYCA
jgi:hypothetical protein